MQIRSFYPGILTVASFFFLTNPVRTLHTKEDAVDLRAGSNSLRYKINHNNFTHDSISFAEVVYDHDMTYVTLQFGDQQSRLSFILNENNIQEREYDLSDPSNKYLVFYYQPKLCTYSSDNYYTGQIKIQKYDSLNKIIAGTFDFIGYSTVCNELVQVSNGMFDASLH